MARVFSISIPEDMYKKALEITGKDKIQDAIRELLKRAIYGESNVNIQGLEEKFKILDKLANEIADIKAEILSLKEEIRKLEVQSRKKSSYHQHPQASSYNKEEDYEQRLMRASKYAEAILEKEGKLTTEQIEKVCKKFNIDFFDFWDLVSALGIYEKEKGIWYPT